MPFIGIGKEEGNFIENEHALGYALSRILSKEDEKEEFLEWYYSGNWIERDSYEKVNTVNV